MVDVSSNRIRIANSSTTPSLCMYSMLQARNVSVTIVFVKVGEIDTVNEKYSAELFLQAKWREPELDGNVTMVGGYNDIWSGH